MINARWRNADNNERKRRKSRAVLAVLFMSAVCLFPGAGTAGGRLSSVRAEEETRLPGEGAESAGGEEVLFQYREYQRRLEAPETRTEISDSGFHMIENQIFPIEIEEYGEVSLIPALDETYSRLVLFFAKEDGQIVYRTDQLETNNRIVGQMK